MKHYHYMVSLLLGPAAVGACHGADARRENPELPASSRPAAPQGRIARQDSPSDIPQQEFAHLTQLPTGPWTKLADALTTARALDDAVEATREILARGGIATRDGDQLLVKAVAPGAPAYATPGETVHLALEARNRRTAARMTAAELAQMLKTFGWPFKPTGRDRDQANNEPKARLK